MKRNILLALFIFLFVTPFAYGRVGVGVATGKIVVQDRLKPGIIYHLPPLTVVNTGDQVSDYRVGISYHQDQPQLEPQQNWFIFSPQEFQLAPGKVQVVTVTLNLPINARPGDYFAYLEAQPIQKDQSGITTISIAAAAKLYFTIVPANILQALYYKATSFWTLYQPWTTIASIIILVVLVVSVFKQFFHLEIGIKPKTAHKHDGQNE